MCTISKVKAAVEPRGLLYTEVGLGESCFEALQTLFLDHQHSLATADQTDFSLNMKGLWRVVMVDFK